MVRVGLIGAGNMGTVHASVYTAMPDVAVAGVTGRGAARAEALAMRCGCPAFPDVASLLAAPDIDAVDVTVPTRAHEEVVVAALTSGKHIFCETPLAPDAASAERMLAAARDHDRLLQVALLSRMAQPGQRLQEAVESGELGAVDHAEFNRMGPMPDPSQVGSAVEHYGDVLEEFLLYDLDLSVWLFGMPRSVRGTLQRNEQVETASVSLIYESGQRAGLTGAFGLPPGTPYNVSARVKGERAELSAVLTIFSDGPPSMACLLTPTGGTPKSLKVAGENPYQAECERFVACVRGEADPALLSAEAAHRSLRVLDAARASIASGDRVAL